MNSDMGSHTPVLVDELINGLAIQDGDVVCDATVGDGGHLAALCERYDSRISLLGCDADTEQLTRAAERIAHVGCEPVLISRNFRYLDWVIAEAGYTEVSRIYFDLGWSSTQMEASGKGFSIRQDEPLDMRYDADQQTSAHTVVNDWDESILETVIRGYGEERYAGPIARAISEAREQGPIRTTQELVEIIHRATPTRYHHGRLHPATRTFQAIRMAVNDEIQALEEGLQRAFEQVSEHGRIAVISFHSLEDRLVKRWFRHAEEVGDGARITKKPIRPSAREREANPRSRSARLRIFYKNSTTV